jgi:hypothetical protein
VTDGAIYRLIHIYILAQLLSVSLSSCFVLLLLLALWEVSKGEGDVSSRDDRVMQAEHRVIQAEHSANQRKQLLIDLLVSSHLK